MIIRFPVTKLSRSIPEKGVRGAYSRLIPPSFEEDFDEIHVVRLIEPQAFVVERQTMPRGPRS